MSGDDGFTEIKPSENKEEKRESAPAIVSVKKPEVKPRVTAVKLPDAFAEQAARDILPVSRETGEPLQAGNEKEAAVDEAIRKHQEKQAATEPKGIFGKARKLLFG